MLHKAMANAHRKDATSKKDVSDKVGFQNHTKHTQKIVNVEIHNY